MTAMDFLNRVQECRDYIERRTRELECWNSMATSLSASNFEPHYNATKNTSAQYERAIEKADEVQRDIEAKYAEMVIICDEINSKIDKLHNIDEQIILRYRHIENLKWGPIAKALHYSRSTVNRIYNDALDHLSEII